MLYNTWRRNKEMEFKIPDKLTFKRKEVIYICRLEGKVIDYWESEFGGIHPVVNSTGEKYYSRKDLERILWIKQLFIVEKMEKSKVREVLKKTSEYQPASQTDISKKSPKGEKLRSIKNQLKEILTILDKHDK
jgi:DNA-binding transcriptional MerR regulator